MSPDGTIPTKPAIPPLSAPVNRAELWGWSLAGVFALALAGLFAVLLVLSRTPFLEGVLSWPDQFFQKGLVAHVVLSFVVWFLAVFSALALQAGDEAGGPSDAPTGMTRWAGRFALSMTSLGMALILISPFIDGGEPSLNNYIPVIINPPYYVGLILVGAGTLTMVLRVLVQVGRSSAPIDPATFLLVTAGIIFIASLAGIFVAYMQIDSSSVDHSYNETLFWGGGHLLQIMNLGLVFFVWDRLGRDSVIGPVVDSRTAHIIGVVLIVIAAIGVSFFGLFGVEGDQFRGAFTTLQYAFGVPILIMAAILRPKLLRATKRSLIQNPASLALVTSITIFAVGAAFGIFVDGADTRTPAHYHGIVGGMNVALVGLFYQRILPLLGRPPQRFRLIKVQIWLYAVGQLMFVVGMFAAGGMGAGRKIAETSIDLETAGALAATAVRDLGGALSIIGGVLFIFIMVKALFRRAAA